ncbi:hypothetical protein VV01_03275 [Luteipulveratus halotolerans]|uniref:Uncharacterized protein n=1 Tax=Luteipulveratus halotolerans TaxID=1631356 RepID=A0A0L6CES7_9MICO|nr:hypothetical protein VV01_03275 [Luteipulveratus halotolerans]
MRGRGSAEGEHHQGAQHGRGGHREGDAGPVDRSKGGPDPCVQRLDALAAVTVVRRVVQPLHECVLTVALDDLVEPQTGPVADFEVIPG